MRRHTRRRVVFLTGLLGAVVGIGSYLYLMLTDDLTEFMLWVYPSFFLTGAIPHNHLGNTALVLVFSSILINGILYGGLSAIITTILARLRG